jgi:RNA-binding protein
MNFKNRVGTALHISRSSGNLILKAENNAKIGDPVFNSGGKKVGLIFDIFGPVKTPFISVRPRIKDPEKLVGEPLFLGRSKR